MRVRETGHAIIYDPEAIAHEEVAASLQQEFSRHIRIGAGNFHALRYTAGFLSPSAGRIAFSFWSHKVFRWLVPFALLLAFFSAVGLAQDPLYAILVAAGGLLACLAFVGYQLELRNVHRAVFSLPYCFISMNLALLLGFMRFLNGSQGLIWQRTAREERPL